MHADDSGRLHYEAEEDLLPPGPWHSRGNKVMAGGQTVAVVVCRHSVAVARRIAIMGHPNDNEEITRLRKRVEALEAENTEL